jgi:hypothetical protein
MHRQGILFAALAFALLVIGPASAQQGTPIAGREVPDPSLCTVEPRSSDILAQTPVAATPGAAPATPQAVVEPSGEPADTATIAVVSDVVRQFYACLNSGDTLRALALFTDEAAPRFLAIRPELSVPPTNATPGAVPLESQIAIVAMTDVLVLPDGRVFAFVTQDDPARPPDGPEPVFFYFRQQDGQWLIDDIQFLTSET